MKLPRLRRSPARTTLLGVAALGVLIWAAVTQLGVSVNSILAQLLLLLALILCIGVLAAVTVVLRKLLQRLLRR